MSRKSVKKSQVAEKLRARFRERMKKLSKPGAAGFRPPGKKEKDQESRLCSLVVRAKAKRLKAPSKQKKDVFRQGKKSGSPMVGRTIAAGDYEKIRKILDTIPDIRSAKVSSVRRALLEGRYQIKNQAVAEKILKEIIFDLN